MARVADQNCEYTLAEAGPSLGRTEPVIFTYITLRPSRENTIQYLWEVRSHGHKPNGVPYDVWAPLSYPTSNLSSKQASPWLPGPWWKVTPPPPPRCWRDRRTSGQEARAPQHGSPLRSAGYHLLFLENKTQILSGGLLFQVREKIIIKQQE